jgi:peroxiredoxin
MRNRWHIRLLSLIGLITSQLVSTDVLAQSIPTDLGNFSESLRKIELENYDSQPYSLSSFENQKLTLFILMAHDCPICQQYTGKFRELAQIEGLSVVGIAPSEGETKESARAFAAKYKFDFPILLDSHQMLTHILKAKVTPEVFLFNQTGDLLYRGKIDNWFYELGKYRNVVTEHYLDDAIAAALAGKAINPNKTEPIGCMLNMSMKHH